MSDWTRETARSRPRILTLDGHVRPTPAGHRAVLSLSIAAGGRVTEMSRGDASWRSERHGERRLFQGNSRRSADAGGTLIESCPGGYRAALHDRNGLVPVFLRGVDTQVQAKVVRAIGCGSRSGSAGALQSARAHGPYLGDRGAEAELSRLRNAWRRAFWCDDSYDRVVHSTPPSAPARKSRPTPR